MKKNLSLFFLVFIFIKIHALKTGMSISANNNLKNKFSDNFICKDPVINNKNKNIFETIKHKISNLSKTKKAGIIISCVSGFSLFIYKCFKKNNTESKPEIKLENKLRINQEIKTEIGHELKYKFEVEPEVLSEPETKDSCEDSYFDSEEFIKDILIAEKYKSKFLLSKEKMKQYEQEKNYLKINEQKNKKKKYFEKMAFYNNKLKQHVKE